MPRRARVVAVGMPHHIIQRGNRRQKVFFQKEDRSHYLSILKKFSHKYKLAIWAYCLMDNHIHLIAVPSTNDGLAKAIGETHKIYTWRINQREKWRGYLWEGRFKSFVMAHDYLYKAVRYVERNPVRAGIVQQAQDYEWSSARAHVKKNKDPLLSEFYLMNEIKDWRTYLADDKEEEINAIRKQIKAGLPWGDQEFIKQLEEKLGKTLRVLKQGRPKSRKGTCP